MGGRGSGKTRAGAEWVRAEVEAGRARRIALVAPTFSDAREGPSGLQAICDDDCRPIYQTSRRRLVWPNGAQAFAFSAEDPDGLRGPQFDLAWCDEIGAWARGPATWDMLMFGLRLGQFPKVAATTTPRPCALVRRLVQDAGRGVIAMTRATTADNAAWLAPGVVDALSDAYGGALIGRQELGGELIEDQPGALFARQDIDARRCPSERGPFDRILVAIDPPAGATSRSDACGTIVAGLRSGVVYVLADLTSKGLQPLDWAKRAVAGARAWGASEIIAEANQGGDMVRQVLQSAGAGPGAGLRVSLRYARASKYARAVPVSVFYQQGHVRHAGAFPELEDEMCAFGPTSGHAAGAGSTSQSPDRLDALVWAVTALLDILSPPPSARLI